MLLFNNKTPKKILYNGLNVAKLVYNSLVVWMEKVLTLLTGYPITLTNSTGDNLVDYKVYGESVQDGEPTPDVPIEIESVGDKTINILDINEWSQTNSSTQYIKVENDKMYVRGGPLVLDSNSKMVKWIKNNIKADTYYTFNFKYGENSHINGQIRLYYTIDGTTYRTDICDFNVTLKAFKLSKNVLDNLSSIYFYGANNDTSYIYEVMILEGSYNEKSIPDYEPYGYRIPIKVNNIITNIYLDEPLRKFKEYTDYIDFGKQKVVRNVVEGILDGSESWNSSGKRYYLLKTSLNIKGLGTSVSGIKSNALPSRTWNEIRNSGTGIATYSDNRIDIRADNLWSTVDEAKEYLANNPIQYIGPALNPTEETIELPNILLNKGTNIIEVDTTIKPSNMEVQYYAKGV